MAQIVERRCKSWILYELLSNAWDEASTKVDVQLVPEDGKPIVTIIVTDDNPRTEDPARIRDEVAAAVQGVPCRNIPGRETAVMEAAALAVPGDTIALLGKGHETVTETAAGPVASDDRELLARALRDAARVKPAHDVEA